jgi:hypothetical protein
VIPDPAVWFSDLAGVLMALDLPETAAYEAAFAESGTPYSSACAKKVWS